MRLKISAPDKTIYEGDVTKATIPTEEGEITVLQNHQPLSSVIKPGLLMLTPVNMEMSDEYIVDKTTGAITLSVSKGLLFVDGNSIIITTSAATTSPEESAEVLAEMQKDMTATLEKIKVEGSVDDVEQAMINLQKITADLRLSKLKHVG